MHDFFFLIRSFILLGKKYIESENKIRLKRNYYKKIQNVQKVNSIVLQKYYKIIKIRKGKIESLIINRKSYGEVVHEDTIYSEQRIFSSTGPRDTKHIKVLFRNNY